MWLFELCIRLICMSVCLHVCVLHVWIREWVCVRDLYVYLLCMFNVDGEGSVATLMMYETNI